MIEQAQLSQREPYAFGTDGIRIKVDKVDIEALGYDFGKMAAMEVSSPHLVIGWDTRESSPILSEAVARGVQSAGKLAIMTGVMPTPGIDYLARKYNWAAVAVTASHNPVTDNGLKLLLPGGGKPSDALNARLEATLNSPQLHKSSQKGPEPLRSASLRFKDQYMDFILDNTPEGLLDKNVALDTACGAFHEIAPFIFGQLGAEIIRVDDEPNGRNINDRRGATDTVHLKRAVQTAKADFGIAFDGDGDRLALIDQFGRELNGDHILYILAKHLKQANKLPNNLVWGTDYSGQGLEKSLRAEGIKLSKAKNGDRYVAQAMASSGAVLGAERSGHVIYGPLASTGDGLLAALKTLGAVEADYKGDWAAAYDSMLDYPRAETTIKLEPGSNGQAIVERAGDDIRKIGETIKKVGRVLVRASGTEPVIRIMVEARKETAVNEATEQLKEAVRAAA